MIHDRAVAISEFIRDKAKKKKKPQRILARRIHIKQPRMSQKYREANFTTEELLILFDEIEATAEEIGGLFVKQR